MANVYYTAGRRHAQLRSRGNGRDVPPRTYVPSSGDSKKLRTAIVQTTRSTLRTTMTTTNDRFGGTNDRLQGCKSVLAGFGKSACKANRESPYSEGFTLTPSDDIRILIPSQRED